MSCIVYQRFNNNEDAISSFFTRGGVPRDAYSCYSSFPYIYDGTNDGGALYHGFYANEKIINLVEEINNNFEHIKVEIVYSDIRPLHGDIMTIYDETGEVYLYSFTGQRGGIEYKKKSYNYVIFKVVLDERYTPQANSILTLAIAEFIRGFNPELYMHRRSARITENYIDNMLLAHKSEHYGCWMCCSQTGTYTCDRETFNKFDDIDLINEFSSLEDFDEDSMPQLSHFIERLMLA